MHLSPDDIPEKVQTVVSEAAVGPAVHGLQEVRRHEILEARPLVGDGRQDQDGLRGARAAPNSVWTGSPGSGRFRPAVGCSARQRHPLGTPDHPVSGEERDGVDHTRRGDELVRGIPTGIKSGGESVAMDPDALVQTPDQRGRLLRIRQDAVSARLPRMRCRTQRMPEPRIGEFLLDEQLCDAQIPGRGRCRSASGRSS
jgi:hypothetical protein